MFVRPAVTADLDAMVALAARLQARPERHIGYLGVDPESIRSDVADVDDWVARTVVLDDAGTLAGWILAETDSDMGRTWWWGPFAVDGADDRTLDLLYQRASAAGSPEEEMAPDDRNRQAARLAERNGFRGETASAVLRYEGAGFGGTGGTRQLQAGDRAAVAALHDRLFPGTHSPGRLLVASEDPRLVAVVDGEVAGYVAIELHSDRSGYIDYLGVDAAFRRRGIARRLVMDATDRLLESGAGSVNLTVRESNAAARRLYESIGFAHERLVRPYRKGFSLEDQTTA
ncbi:MAG TPA: GNAT family N-acetyltransferase [Acidimicrobiia bacterium]|nr:GNAT family N-acetyltransferase [Acidimicrobiia bacterium]